MKKFFAILAFLTVAVGSFAQLTNSVRITTDCKITRHVIGLIDEDENIDFGPTLAYLDWKIQIEYVQLGNGGICKAWLINDDGKKTLIQRWSNLESLYLYKSDFVGNDGTHYKVYTLDDGVLHFFTLTVTDNGDSFYLGGTEELL